MTQRVLRSHSRSLPASADIRDPPLVLPQRASYRLKHTVTQPPRIIITENLTTKTTALSKKDLSTLKLKRTKLLSPASQTSHFIASLPETSTSTAAPTLKAAAQATLVFAQHEAGTAVCIAASGLLLTCSHCVAETQEEYAEGTPHWLIFSTGRVAQAKCVAWDPKRDLALLQIVAAEREPTESPLTGPAFPFATIASQPPPTPKNRQKITPLFCIGHPGSEDLEADPESSTPIPSNYDVLHVSDGHYRGLATGRDVQDNSDIGALKHDCWTYWGHSGAPLIDGNSGELVGLHSSWDDRTGMRRGIAWAAIEGFLGEWCEKV